MKHPKLKYLCILAIAFGLMAGNWSCTNEVLIDDFQVSEGDPVHLIAEIDNSLPTKANLPASNEYDRMQFISGDKIRVFKKYGGTVKQQVDYSFDADSWITTDKNPVTLQASATYYAVYPYNNEGTADKGGILQNQTDKMSYLQSNRLQTIEIFSRDGVLRFTGENAFIHKNTKLTLLFQPDTGAPALSGSFKSTLIIGPGLRTGGSTEESISLYRPDNLEYSWCGILYPQNSNTDISISLTYENVVYKVTLTCGMKPGTHYSYTLTIKNGILVPTGSSIQDWTPVNVDDPGNLS